MDRPAVTVIGSGNVATHLALALDKVAEVKEVCSSNINHAQALASRISGCRALDNPANISTDSDYYLIAVKDDAISDVAAQMPEVRGVIMHTSGSKDMEVLGRFQSHGVFYPLQTFSKTAEVDVSAVPLFLEANSPETLAKMETLGRAITSKINYADSRQRTILHIAAVFGCNFVNYLWDISSQILEQNGYSLDVLRPLLEVTLQKAFDKGPHVAQTGPAIREDQSTIDRHLSVLSQDNAEIYSLLTKQIINSHKPTN